MQSQTRRLGRQLLARSLFGSSKRCNLLRDELAHTTMTTIALGVVLLLHELNASGNQLFHDLIGSAIDSLNSTVTVGSGDREFPHISPTTMELNTFIDNLALKIS
jgi:hypothetical protein